MVICFTFAARFKDPGIDKVGKNGIDVIFESVFVPKFPAGIIKTETVVKSLSYETMKKGI